MLTKSPVPSAILTDLGGTGRPMSHLSQPHPSGAEKMGPEVNCVSTALARVLACLGPPGQEPPKDGHLSSTCPTWLCTVSADWHRASQAIAELKCLLRDGLGPSSLWHSFPSPQPQDGAEGAWFGDGCWVLKFDRHVFESQLCHLLILGKFLNHFSVSFPICSWY